MKKYEKFKNRIFEIIQIGNRSDFPSLFFDIFIVAVIVINLFITFFETFEASKPYMGVLRVVETVTIIIFLVEYILRVWTADNLYPDKSEVAARFSFVRSFYGVIDLLTILPFFLPMVLPSGVGAFRMLRVVRIMHLFRINAQYDTFNVITAVLKDKRNQLLASLFLIVVLMVGSSLAMYSFEHEAQPENFANAFSGIWWSMSTLLTVGYGDIYPVTVAGKILAIIIAFLGVGLVAIPTGIISAGFVEYFTKIKTGKLRDDNMQMITLHINAEHEFCAKMIKDIEIPDGMFPAVILRGNDVVLCYDEMVIKAEDNLIIGGNGEINFDAVLEETVLDRGHKWIGKMIKDIDISRQSFIIKIVRGKSIIRPTGSTVLLQNDTVTMLTRTIE